MQKTLKFDGLSIQQLKNMLGEYNAHIKLIEKRIGIKIYIQQDEFTFVGSQEQLKICARIMQDLYNESKSNDTINAENIHMMIQTHAGNESLVAKPQTASQPRTHETVALKTRKGTIYPRGDNQKNYVSKILQSDVSFGVGPAGTGKTYLAVAAAVDMFERNEVERILLVRPAVEAGEKLGFLPGDLTQKIDPYLRPLYDALYEMLGSDKVTKMLEQNMIEIAPLAYMRGRTLNNSFVILDEAQNTTPEQMKMFLTRLGFGSRAVITGDISQIDLPRGQKSGLGHALHVLKSIKEIHITMFEAGDVLRHQLVQKIVTAYDKDDARVAFLREQKKQEHLEQQKTQD